MPNDPAARLLRLLSLFQSRPTWSGDELADRLDVTTRTVRRDVSRLRDLGYPVDAAPGIVGGYRLAPGGRLPPLLLDDDEAVAIAIGLRLAATSAVAGIEASAVAALTKLDQVLPPQVRERVAALTASTIEMRGRWGEEIDADALVALATGCRRAERVTFGYRDHAGNETEKRVEPLQIVHAGKRWYLVGRDVDRDAWRTYRVDRIARPLLTGHRFERIDPPDAERLVSEGINVAPWGIEARIALDVDLATARRWFPPTMGVIDQDGQGRTVLRVAAESLPPLAAFVGGLRCDAEVLDPPELRDEVRRLGRKLARRNA